MTLQELLTKQEGCEYKVYPDSLGKPTVGIGHLVIPKDKLKIGDVIDKARVSAFFKADSAAAMAAAKSQASKAGISNPNFIIHLASVNFQLGVNWNHHHKKTWDLIMKGEYDEAAKEAQKSTWYSQTPNRVKDFQKALRALPEKPGTQKATK